MSTTDKPKQNLRAFHYQVAYAYLSTLIGSYIKRNPSKAMLSKNMQNEEPHGNTLILCNHHFYLIETICSFILFPKFKKKVCFVMKGSNGMSHKFLSIFDIEYVGTPGATQKIIDRLKDDYIVVVYYSDPYHIKTKKSLELIMNETKCRVRFLTFDVPSRPVRSQEDTYAEAARRVKYNNFFFLFIRGRKKTNIAKVVSLSKETNRNIFRAIIKILFKRKQTIYMTMSDEYDNLEDVRKNKKLLCDLSITHNKNIDKSKYFDVDAQSLLRKDIYKDKRLKKLVKKY